uniref:Uncharacterized protein n=1 Tax=Arion vulgaris TaxID=1028688 RepID=A0A0B7AT13_9EUPU
MSCRHWIEHILRRPERNVTISSSFLGFAGKLKKERLKSFPYVLLTLLLWLSPA